MGEHVAEGNLCNIPDDLAVPQFILDSAHPTYPWLVDDTTGRQIGFEEVSRKMTDDVIVTSGPFAIENCVA
jgi:hypothetical protein